MNKKIKLGLFVFIFIGIILVSIIYYFKKPKEVKRKRKQNEIAILIKEDGADNYIKSTSKDIPKGDYTLNYEKSYCKNNGVIGDYDNTLGKVSFSFVGTDSCFLYFDYKEDTSLYGTIKKRAKTDTTYLALYEGEGANTYANPVYYYKGNVQNNNVLFAGFCWKIVRTTETGGVKIVYNGVQKNGSCNNTGTDSQIGTSAFSNDNDSLAYVGYMYNTVYPVADKSMSSQSNIVFGNSFDYNSNNGTYTLKDTKTVVTWSSGYNTINNNHYTCMTTGATCSSVYYVYYVDSVYAYYITLTNGKSVNDALNEMLYANDVNKNDSIIKTYIDSWYENNLASYEDKLEDTVFCNDRKLLDLGGWNPNGGSTTSYLQFKNSNTSNQSLVCANETDRFSMSNSKAKLNHPIGLISVPELSLAGYGSSHFFNNGQYVWLVSPSYFNFSIAYVRMARSGGFTGNLVSELNGVRPSVSLKPGTYFSSGDGSFTNPFVIGDAVEEPSGKSFDTVFAANNTDIFDENGIRYEGTDSNNYICLDNQESGSCSDSSLLFRIIGLFDEDTSSDGTTSAGTKKLLKVIDTNNYGGTAGKKWDTNNSKDWKSASLAIDLNENYYNSLIGLSDTNSKLLDNITMAKWRLGTYADDSVRNYSIYELFSMEHNENSEYVYEKVGLMYPSDYGYSSVGGTTTNKSDCLNAGLMNWKSYNDCYSNSWLYNSAIFVNKAEWFLTPGTINYSGYLGQYDNGYVYTLNNFFLSTGLLAVRPTLYLDAETLKIVGGTGSQTDPYHIG